MGDDKQKIEGFKLLHDYHKHLATLSTAVLLVVVLTAGQIMESPAGMFFFFWGVLLSLFTIISSQMAMLFRAKRLSKKVLHAGPFLSVLDVFSAFGFALSVSFFINFIQNNLG